MNITAHIPVQSYGYIELNDLPDDPAEIERLYNRYAEKPIRLTSDRVKMVDWFGNEFWYNEARHEYSNEAGELYESASQIAEKSKPVFDKQSIALAMAKKSDRSADEILSMWEMNSDISKGLGTALHAAMEMYGKYKEAHKSPFFSSLVESFYTAHPEEAHYEVAVIDHKAKRAARIDRLEKHPDGFWITDFKTDRDILKELPRHQVQLNVAWQILEANGLTPKGMAIYHTDGKKWTTYNLERQKV